MSEIVTTQDMHCFFCKKPIKWDAQFISCPECDGSGNDPYGAPVCPYCGGDGFIEADDYLPCCELCFEKEYREDSEVEVEG